MNPAAVDRAMTGNLPRLLIMKSASIAYFHLPIIVLFWQDNGLSLTEIMLLQSIFAFATVLLEFPSGVFADLYGRRPALVLAVTCNVVAVFIYCLADSFWGFLAGELLMAVFVAFVSGADTALLYDSLKALRREDEFPRFQGNVIFWSTMCLAGANVAGGFIGAVDLRMPLWFTFGFTLLAIPVALTLREPPRTADIGAPSIGSQLRVVRATITADRGLVWLMVYAGIVMMLNQAPLWLYQPYFALSGIDIAWYGVIFASFQVVAASGSKWYYLLRGWFGEARILAGLIIATAVASLALGSIVAAATVAFVFLHQLVRGVYKIIFSDMINRRVESGIRASVLSIQNLGGRLLTALMMPLYGLVADVYDVPTTLLMIGLTGVSAAPPILFLLYRHRLV